MTHFRPSIIATMVASALTVGSNGAVSATSLGQLNIDAAKFSTVNSSAALSSGRAVASKATVSGMKNTFDAKLNKVSFIWQSADHLRPEMVMVAPEERNAYAGKHYLNALTGMSAGKVGTSSVELKSIHDTKRGGIVARYTQRVNDVEVFNRSYNVMMDQNHNLVAGSGYFANVNPGMALQSGKKTTASFGDPAKAINAAFSDMGGDSVQLNAITRAAETNNDYTAFNIANSVGNGKQLVGEPRSKRVYFEQKGKLIAAHYVEVQVAQVDEVSTDYFSYVIDAKSQKVLFKNNLTSHADEFSYRAYANTEAPFAPWDGPHGNVNPAESADQLDPSAILDAPMVTLTAGPISTMDPWLTEGATETMGNNVAAYIDVLAPDGLSFGDYTAGVTSAGIFDYKLDTSEKEYSINNRKAAIVNLFYLNNYLHDEFYDHGFDEMSGNAQIDNFERGGEGNDPLLAEVQDYSGTDNANMSTPADGASPRMQMFLWNQAKNGVHFGVTLTSHPEIGLLDNAASASFGALNFDVTGDLVRFVDGVEEVKDGCESAVNPDQLAGKIAVIDRGACGFTVKVKNAQDAGAIAVLIANNRDGDVARGLGGVDDSVTIPSLMISQNGGITVDALLDAGETVTVNMVGSDDIPFKASSWDNAIVAHEWGHYISNRLVGNASGLSNNQGGSMGEGWGDFHALLTVSEADEALIDGNDMFQKPYAAITYVRSFYNGIRSFPYTTDMTINEHTFDSIEDNAQVHASGNVWATFLWDSFVGLINDERHDYAQAKSLMMDYLVAGYKMTPNAPTFVEARDAILAAVYANDVEDYNTILAAFARRGMGLGAIAPDRESTTHQGVVESYAVTHSALELTSHSMDANYEGMSSGYCSNDHVVDKGETGTVSFTVTNRGSETYAGVTGQIEVTSGHDVTFANEGVVSFGDLGVTGIATSTPIEFTLNDAGTAEELAFKVTFPSFVSETNEQAYMLSTTVNYDFNPLPLVGHNATTGAETLAILNDFKENVLAGGDRAKGTGRLSHDYAQFWRDNGVEMGEGSLFIQNNNYFSDVAYETGPIVLGLTGTTVFNWLHYFNFEDSFDGGVIEIKINEEEWVDVLDGGGTFLGAGYSGSLIAHSSQPLPDRAAFTGAGAAFEAVQFSDQLNGSTVRLRFRAGSDGGASAEGWVIDDIGISNIDSSVFSEIIPGDTNACDNRLPFVSQVSEAQTVNEGGTVTLAITAIDPNQDALTYAWTQTSGTTVSLTEGATESASFTAPSVAAGGETLEFEVVVSDGTGSVSRTTSVTVNDVPAPVVIPVAKTKRSSGGSTGLFALLLLPLALLRRRK